MRNHLKYFFALFVFLNFTFLAQKGLPENDDIPKNIILFIGDGMGVSAVTGGFIVKGNLNLEQFKTAGLLITFPYHEFLQHSEGGTTALATGFTTKAHYMALLPSGKSIKTVLEYAQEKGKSTGLVTAAAITDVTPATFVSHTKDRYNHVAIAEDITRKGVDVLFGGGLRAFIPASSKGSIRKDKKDLIAQLKKHSQVITSDEEFEELGRPKSVAGLFSLGDMPQVSERPVTKLPAMAKKAIEILSSNKNGFFLMVEGAFMDWAAHRKDSEWLIREVIDFDEAVGVGLQFAKENGETLVIVASDHETGGYTLLDGSLEEKTVKVAVFATNGHTAQMVPLFAYGPGSAILGGIHDQAFVGRSMIDYVKRWEPKAEGSGKEKRNYTGM